jgi:hypothetical protein
MFADLLEITDLFGICFRVDAQDGRCFKVKPSTQLPDGLPLDLVAENLHLGYDQVDILLMLAQNLHGFGQSAFRDRLLATQQVAEFLFSRSIRLDQ